MNIQAEKLELMRMILETENSTLLESIKNLFKKEYKKDFWMSLPDDQKEEILDGVAEAEQGYVIDYNDVMKNFN